MERRLFIEPVPTLLALYFSMVLYIRDEVPGLRKAPHDCGLHTRLRGPRTPGGQIGPISPAPIMELYMDEPRATHAARPRRGDTSTVQRPCQ